MNRQDAPAADVAAAGRRRERRQGLPRSGGRGAGRGGCGDDRRRSNRAAQPCGAVSRDVLLAAAAAQLPSVRAGAARPGPRVGRGHRLRASRTGEPGRLDALSPGHAAGEERRDGSRAGCARARAGAATGPRRGQQRSRRAARAGRRPRWGDRPLPRRARGHARLSRRAEQPRLRSAAHRATTRRPVRSTRRPWRCSPTSPRR